MNEWVENGTDVGQQYMDKPIERVKKSREENTSEDVRLRDEMKKFPLPEWKPEHRKKILNVLIGLIILLIIWKFVAYFTGPEYLVKQMFKNEMIDGNVEILYDMIDLPEGEFMTKEQFCNQFNNRGTLDITNYKINNIDSNTYADQDYNLFGNNEREDPVDFVKNYFIQYTVKGKSDLFKMNYQAVRKKGFIPKWKISCNSSLLAEKVTISVPHNSTIALDGILLGGQYLVQNDYYGEEYKNYCVDVFAGEHSIKVSMPYMKDVYLTEVFHTGNNYTISDFELEDSTVDLLETNMVNVLQDMYGAVYNSQGFDSVAKHFILDSYEQAHNTYTNLEERLHGDEYVQLENISFTNFKSYIESVEIYQGETLITAKLDYDYSYDYNYYRSSWNGEGSWNKEIRESNDSMRVRFVLDENQWKINDIDLYSVY